LAHRAAAIAYRLGLRRSGIVRGAVLALCHGPSKEFLTQLMNDLGVGRAPFEATSIPGAAVFEAPCQPGAERATLTTIESLPINPSSATIARSAGKSARTA
jgi:hypothetical protein